MRRMLMVAAVLLAWPALAQNPAPDLVLTGGKVFTADDARPFVEALAIRGDRIVAVGSSAEISRLAGLRTRRVNLRGRTVVPGFNDAHDHLPHGNATGYAFRFDAPLEPGPSARQILDSLRVLVKQLPSGTWLWGEIGLTGLLDANLRREVLDQVAPRHPVMLAPPWGHGAILNSKALQLMGIDDQAPDPIGGHFERVPGSQKVSGMLSEYAKWNAQRTFDGQQPNEVWVALMQQYGAEALRYGITSVQNMAGGLPAAQTMQVLRAAQLPLRLRVMPMPMTTTRGLLRREWVGVDPHPTPLTTVSGRKYILDATPLEGGALMRRAYPGRPGWHGQLNFPVDTVRKMLREALTSTEPLMLHVSGDSTASLVLKLMSELADDATWRTKRVRFEHGDGVAADLQPKAKALGVVVVQNPSHYINPALTNPGEKSRFVAPFRSLLAAGIPFALGSDGPVNPFLNIMFATTLADPKEALTREQAVQAYTAGSAYAEFAEKEKGTLMPGKLADLAVLSQDVFTVPTPALPATVSELTMVGGKVVYEAKPVSKR
ncbi:amidohydrolase [Hymenobacter busanensis]|uniref:Amidohydrolase n=1 Tax=Hymenobacter busanensis TaxID=2607656 RepID=A0A7L4ZXB4_9BACT|nr:amidohydrolase [Hymenobacter busanensis]KAA9325329.1 amidohydrolase [Hymenobacter busanensis]QHJ07677.1 amidohydrolase family protein [Hymenobacter busanensis]